MKTRIVMILVSLFVFSLLGAAQAADTGLTFVVTVNSQGEPADNNSFEGDISADGRYVAFRSYASNLIDPPEGYYELIYVRDNQTGHLELVSVRYDGTLVQDGAEKPSLSGDGRYVAFLSDDPWLLPEATYGPQVYVRDRVTGTNALASISSTGEKVYGNISDLEIAANGRHVVFSSDATNVVPEDSDYRSDVFVHDLQTGQTTLISKAPDGTPGYGESGNARISDDGNVIVYGSSATNLVAGDDNGAFDIFIYDRAADQTTRVELGIQADLGIAGDPAISGNGRYVAFSTGLGALTGEEDGARWDVFLYDRQGGPIERVSLDSDDQVPPVGLHSFAPDISYDGSQVSFVAIGQLTPIETNFGWHYAYLRDRTAGTTELISVGVNGASSVDTYPATRSPMSADGRFVLFRSGWPTVVGEEHGGDGVYVRDRAPEATTFTIEGMVYAPGGGPLAGVTVSDGLGHEATTGANGTFAMDVPSGIYRLVAQKVGYAFEPLVDFVTVPPEPATPVAFQSRVAYDISGRVVGEDGFGVSGIGLSLGGDVITYTDSDGLYRIDDVAPGDYTLTPVHEDFNFQPAERSFTLNADRVDQDFVASYKLSSISGTILDQDGAPLEGVTVMLDDSPAYTTTTDAAGYYAFTNIPMLYSPTVRPSLDGYRFEPEYMVIDLPRDVTGVDFTGISLAVETIYVSGSAGGKIGKLVFNAADILAYDLASSAWSMYFDGSDVGLTRNVNNFAIQQDGSLLLTLTLSQRVPGVGVVAPHDVLRFTPSELGANTAGTLELYFDGSDVGMSAASERIDALTEWQSALMLSTRGKASLLTTGWTEPFVARDDEMLLFSMYSSGWYTEGFWQRLGEYRSHPADLVRENVTGLSHDLLTDIVYTSYASTFNILGVSGRPGTVIGLQYDYANDTYDAFRLWDARTAGLPVALDGFEVGRD